MHVCMQVHWACATSPQTMCMDNRHCGTGLCMRCADACAAGVANNTPGQSQPQISARRQGFDAAMRPGPLSGWLPARLQDIDNHPVKAFHSMHAASKTDLFESNIVQCVYTMVICNGAWQLSKAWWTSHTCSILFLLCETGSVPLHWSNICADTISDSHG